MNPPTGDDASHSDPAASRSDPAPAGPDRTTSTLPSLTLTHSEGGSVEIYLQGAHIASWRLPGGEDVLFMSRLTRLDPGVPIRGGIPIVFPQFSKRGPLPQHGFARTSPWEVVERGVHSSGAGTVRLRLSDTEATRVLWPHSFLAELLVTLDQALSATVQVTNTGSEPFTFTSALHTYYQVGDVRTVTVDGLEGSRFLGIEPNGNPLEVTGPLRIQQETDGVYAGVGQRLRLLDPSLARTLLIETEGFADAVVWNPWIERARAMPDFGDDEYLTMLCIEPANIEIPTHLRPGETWSGTQRIRVTEGG